MDPTRKSRYCAGEHLNDTPSYMIHASVVIPDSVITDLLISDLNDIDTLAGDIQNAYLNAPTKEKDFFYAGYERKCDEGNLAVLKWSYMV